RDAQVDAAQAVRFTQGLPPGLQALYGGRAVGRHVALQFLQGAAVGGLRPFVPAAAGALQEGCKRASGQDLLYFVQAPRPLPPRANKSTVLLPVRGGRRACRSRVRAAEGRFCPKTAVPDKRAHGNYRTSVQFVRSLSCAFFG